MTLKDKLKIIFLFLSFAFCKAQNIGQKSIPAITSLNISRYEYDKDILGKEENYKSLKWLVLRDSIMITVPETINNLPKLERLILRGGKFVNTDSLFTDLSHSTTLQELYLNNINVNFNESILKLKDLKDLSLNKCKLTFEGDVFSKLRISFLIIRGKLSENELQIISKNDFIDTVYLEEENTRFPYELSEMKNLELLTLVDLVSGKYEISGFKNLKIINLPTRHDVEIKFIDNPNVKINLLKVSKYELD